MSDRVLMGYCPVLGHLLSAIVNPMLFETLLHWTIASHVTKYYYLVMVSVGKMTPDQKTYHIFAATDWNKNGL